MISPSRLTRWLLITVLIAAFLVETVTAAGIYFFGWRGHRTTAWTRFVPVPVASVGWHILSAHAWLEQNLAVAHYNNQLTASSPSTFPARTASQNSQVAMTKIVRDRGLTFILSADHIRLAASDVEQAYQTQLTQTGNPSQIAETVRQLYNWSPEQFKQNVIRTVVGRDKLQEKLSFDPELSAAAQKQADRVLALVHDGQQSFEDLAKSYSDDAYGAQGGDLGFVSRGTQVQEIDDAAFSLPVGSTSQVIHTKYGFHIIKIIELITVDGQDQVHLKQIFIAAPSVDQYLTSWLKQRTVWVWLPDLKWDRLNGQATAQ